MRRINYDTSTSFGELDSQSMNGAGIIKPPESASFQGVDVICLTMTYFHGSESNYHRREGVSLSCSGWEGVGPPCYGRQAKLVLLGLAIRKKHNGVLFGC